MANDKMTWVELRKAVAEMAGTSEQEAGQFLSAMIEGIQKGLREDSQVKIKGIGTFALKQMAARKSVNIATGEEFTIDSYNKLTFNAEASLKESVEKRLDSLKTANIMKEINADPIQKLGEQADEIVDILADLGQAPSNTNNATTPIEETPATSAEPSAEETTVEEVVVEETATETETIEEEKTAVEIPTETKEEVKEEAKEAENKDAKPQETKPKKKTGCLIGCFAVLFFTLFMAGCVAAWYFRAPLIQWWQCMKDCRPQIEEIIETDQQVDTIAPTVEQEIVIENTVEEQPAVILPLAQQPREYNNILRVERVGKNSRLAWIAYKHYEEKDLWVFIYEANRDIIKNPKHILEGQELRIPELDDKYRDLNNPELRQLVDSLAAEYLSIQK
jgi:nucleoid DNA-binding protein